MNKLFIVLLALCLVTVHAFVKRDAPAPSADNPGADIGKSLKEFLDSVNAQFSETFNPEQMKKNFNAVVDGVQNSLNQLKTNSEPTKQ